MHANSVLLIHYAVLFIDISLIKFMHSTKVGNVGKFVQLQM